MSYDFNEITRRLQTGEFRALGLEGINFYGQADDLFDLDADFPCMLVQMASDGFFPALSRAQIRAFMSLMLAVQDRRDNPATPSSQPSMENPGQDVPEIPEAFRQALRSLDLESL